jgi:Outer membrane protein beta-barrel domain
MKSFAFASCIGILALASANAQEFSKFTFDIGGGYVAPVGSTSNNRDPGWSVRGGAGVNISPHLGIMLDLGYDSLGISSTSLVPVGATGGDVNVFHATVDPVVRFRGKGRLNFYLTGGGGLFHRYKEVDFGSAPQLTNTLNKPGFDVGGGLEYGAFARGKFFTEARWEHMFFSNTTTHMDFIPVSFGFRW